jgi:hydroxymethylglutaryl-CoA lyase
MLICKGNFRGYMADSIRLYEVGMRDGLQTIEKEVTTDQKVALAEMLIKAGLDKIEIGSFVHPALVPQMRDTDVVFTKLVENLDFVPEIAALVPNREGLERGLESEIEYYNIYFSPSGEFNARNLGTPSLDRIFERYEETILGMPPSFIRAYISCAFSSPFEDYDDASFIEILNWCSGKVGTVVLADTNGSATPKIAVEKIKLAKTVFDNVAVHFHKPSTKRVGFEDLLNAAYLSGVREFDCSVGGLGGCPFVPGSFGNLSTQFAVDWANDYGIPLEQKIDNAKLEAAEVYLQSVIKIPLAERARRYISRKLRGVNISPFSH